MKARRVREPRIPTLKGMKASERWSCNPEFDQSGTKLRLSESQCAVFARGPFVGAGSFATVFEHPTDDGKVVKFTTDSDDAKSAAILKGKDLVGAARVYEVAKLENITVPSPMSKVLKDGRWVPMQMPVYGIVAERLDPTNNAPENLKTAILAFKSTVESLESATGAYKDGLLEPGPGFKVGEGFTKKALATCRKDFKANGLAKDGTCEAVIPKLQAAIEEVGRSGIFTADLHHGNWGKRPDGSFALLDFGISLTSPSASRPVPQLAKAPKNRFRRKKR
jgi:hypothetical protein